MWWEWLDGLFKGNGRLNENLGRNAKEDARKGEAYLALFVVLAALAYWFFVGQCRYQQTDWPCKLEKYDWEKEK